MNAYNWLNSSGVEFMVQAHNNLNVLTHPLYYTMRSKIKNDQRVSDNMSLLCAASLSSEKNEENIAKELVNARLTQNSSKKQNDGEEQLACLDRREEKEDLKKGEMKLYDKHSFSNNRTYILDTDEPFSREDFLFALRDSTRDPIKYINSSKYIARHINCPEGDTDRDYQCVDEDEVPEMSFLHILDPANLVQLCVSNGLISPIKISTQGKLD